MVLSSFTAGMPYIIKPPTRSARSNTVTAWPARFSSAAQAKPAEPEPTTATFLPVRKLGGLAVTQPSRKARSAMAAFRYAAEVVNQEQIVPLLP
jgi:hypothetical protein